VWLDWVLLAAGLCGVVLEATLRPNLAWRPVAVLVTVWFCVLPLWRRTRPLATVALAFGAVILLNVATVIAGEHRSIGLDTRVVLLVLVYALPRWGSGREIVLGTGVMLAAFAVSDVEVGVPIGEHLAGAVVLLFLPALLGASMRFRATAHERQLAQARSRERERLARELHDTVAHHVSAMVISAQAGRVIARTDPSAAVGVLEGVEEEGARTMEEMRAMVAALRDGEADAELTPGGVADLERVVRAPGGLLRVDLRLDGDLDALPPAVDAAVYRIVQESVTNAMRHAADATEVVVQVIGEPHTVRVTVRDDGARPGRGRGRDGYGLAGLRERAALLGGELHAGPGADRGWCVEAELPRGRADGNGHPRPRR
jgi:signal transduction histidine kinase